MRVAVAGASGLIGGSLSRVLLERGDEVVALVRGGSSGIHGARDVRWDPAEGPLAPEALEGVDAVVNLAGASIESKRWTAGRKRLIRESRTLTTRLLVDAIAASGSPRALVNGSAVGYYGTGEETADETSPPGSDFLADTCVAWEREAYRARDHGIRVATVRTGLVLAAEGGILPRLSLPVRLFVGGPLGSGRQWFSWVHMDDELGVLVLALDRDDLDGPLNATAPEPVRQRELVKALAHVLGRPAVVPAPAVAVRLALGEMSILALEGRRAVPTGPLAAGYVFAHEEIDEALDDLLR